MGSEEDTCVVCFETAPLRQLECTHAFCVSCLQSAVNHAIGANICPIPCLQCAHPLPRPIIRELLLGEPERWAAFERMELMLCLKRDPLVRFCPTPNCPAVVACEASQARCPRIRCDVCHGQSCFLCRQPWHEGVACKFESSDTTKPCPNCGVTIFKARGDGCNAMKCSVCSWDFCWLCLRKIDGMNGMGHFTSLSGCTMFGEKQWSRGKRLAVQLSAPLTMPFAAAGAVVMTAAMLVATPAIVGRDEWRRPQTSLVSR